LAGIEEFLEVKFTQRPRRLAPLWLLLRFRDEIEHPLNLERDDPSALRAGPSSSRPRTSTTMMPAMKAKQATASAFSARACRIAGRLQRHWRGQSGHRLFSSAIAVFIGRKWLCARLAKAVNWCAW
jgi:hypothetical protein